MSKPLLSRHRPLRSPVAALLACVLLPGAAFADDGDETLGVVSPITLPAQAKATPAKPPARKPAAKKSSARKPAARKRKST